MKIEEFYKRKEISVRSYHVCKYNNLNSLRDLKEYFDIHNSFDKLKNCGKKSNEELIRVCNIYGLDPLGDSLVDRGERCLKSIFLKLTRTQREVISSFIFVNTNSLSIRSKNGILLHLNNNIKIKNFTEKIFTDSFDINNISNIGAKCIPEIEIYISIIKRFLIEVSESDDEKHLISLKNNFLIHRTFSITKTPSKILESESIFLLTDFLINEGALFGKVNTIVFKNALNLYQNQEELNLDAVGSKVNLTRERVRQIRKVCIDELFDKLLFILNFNDDLYRKYNIDVNSNQIDINTDVVESINILNETNFSKGFISYLLFIYLSNTYSIVGNVEDVLFFNFIKSKTKYNWNNFFLIKKELSNELDFDVLALDIDRRLSNRIQESYSFNFKSYLSRFLTNNNIEILDLLFPIAENIVNVEFELYIDLEESLSFNRNTHKQVYEYAYEALEQLGKQSTVNEIFEKVLELYPNYDTEEFKIRVSMKRRNGFVPIGRRSVFGLKKWEEELDGFRGGTIRTIAEEFLVNHNEPQDKKEIEKHVKKYRPKTNANSIYNNLYIDESNTFSFFDNYHIGLTRKVYSDKFKLLNKSGPPLKNTWEESLVILNQFILEHGRLPYSGSLMEEEVKIYRWLNVQKGKISKGKIDEEKVGVINEIFLKFPQSDRKKRLNPSEKYKMLIDFVEKNGRLPSANKIGEEYLYHFFYNQRKLFDKNELKDKEEMQFIEVAKLIQNN